MNDRREFEMTQADYDEIIEACRSVPLVALQCGMPKSPQENANDAWCRLGARMGFDGMSVQAGRSKLHFTALSQGAQAPVTIVTTPDINKQSGER